MSEISMQRKKSLFLYSFCNLYKVSEEDTEDYIDTISCRDILEYYSTNETVLIYPKLKTNVMRTLQQFGLDKKEIVKVVPAIKPDIFINTDKNTTEESCQMVKAFLNHS